MASRGRRPRAATASTARVELRLTLDELRTVQRLAKRHNLTTADLLRTGLLELCEDLDDSMPMVLGRDLKRRRSVR